MPASTAPPPWPCWPHRPWPRRASLGPRPRLRILNQFAPFDTERVEAVLDSTEDLIQAVREWMEQREQLTPPDRRHHPLD
jgi:hypothetical protein